MHANYTYRFLVVLFFGILFVGCEKDDVPEEMVSIEPVGTEKYLTLGSEVVFNQDKVHRFDINISEANLRFLDNDPVAEEYVAGSVTYDGETLSPVGVRYKGSIGAFANCVSGGNLGNPSGRKTCTKLSMKIKINWEGREDLFYGLKKIQLHSQNLDRSHLRERLGYWIFGEMDVAAPRSVHATVYINGEYQGLFALTEQIDGRLVRENFNDGKGNLYKEVWPLDFNGNPQSDNAFLEGLKTNEDENPSIELMKSFATEIANAPSSEIKNVLNKWTDMDRTIAMAAVDRTIRHDDGPFHWYCSGGGCENHNFYWYEETDQSKLHLIPWDLDNAFENILGDNNPITPIKDGWNEISNDCEPFNYGIFNLQQKSAGCDKIIGGWTLFDTEYNAKLDYLKNVVLEENLINSRIDNWAAQIQSSVQEANTLHNDAVSVGQWQDAVSQLKSALEFARNN